MATKKASNKMSAGSKVAIGVSAVALAAASYYFFGPDGKKHRNKLKGWMIKMKGEIVEKMEQAKDITESAYHTIVDTVAARYKNSGISQEDLGAFVTNLKKQWKGFSGGGASKKKSAAKKKVASAKAAPKKAAKKRS